MAGGWEQAEEMAEAQRAEAGVFQKWEADGECHVMVFCGAPYARKMHWTGSLYEDCVGKRCAHCEGGGRTTLRVSLNAFHVAERRMKIVEGGTRWFADVQKVRKKYGLDVWAFEITRNGAARDPKTTYSILPDHQLDEAMQEEIARTDVNDLARDATSAAHEAFVDSASSGVAANSDREHTDSRADAASTRCITHATAKEIQALLKERTKAQAREFFAVFDINGISQLKAADEHNARRFIAALDEDLPL